MAALKQLKGLNDDLEVVEEEAAAARKKLDKGFIKRVEPFYTRRRGIVTGKEEPSEDLLEGYEDPAGASGSFKDVKGIPYFWLTVLRHQDTIAEFITKRDEGALEYLEDVCVANPPGGEGIRVDFHFSPNPYFSNKVLSKQIAITQAASPLLEMSPGNISEECPPIEWKAGMSLLLRESKKKEKKGKGGKGGKGGEEPGAEGAVKLKRCAYAEGHLDHLACTTARTSFFSFFTNTLKVAEDSDDEGGAFAIDPAALPSEGRGGRERRSARDEKLAAAHLEILTALWKDVVPNAVTLYTSGAFAIERQKDEAAAEEDDYEVVSAAEASLENLPKKVRQRLHALQALQTQVVSLRRDLRKEAHAGEEFFEEKAAKLHAARREVLSGRSGEGGDGAEEGGGETVVPRFWLLALKGSGVIEVIQRRDEKVLKFLKDIRWRRHKLGVWSIDLDFYPNPYIENSTLTKTFKFNVQDEEDGGLGDDEEPRLVGTEETAVRWKEGADLTQRRDEDREDGGKGRMRKTRSFFHLFSAGASPHLFTSRGQHLKEAECKDLLVQVAVALRAEVVPHPLALYRVAAAWDSGEPGSGSESSEDDSSGESEGGDDDEAAAKRRPKSGKRKGKKSDGAFCCGLGKGGALIACIAFMMLAELLMFIEQSAYWRGNPQQRW